MTSSSSGSPTDARMDEAELERVVRGQANRAAGRLVWFLGHAIVWGLGDLLILVTAGAHVALLVSLAWSVGLASHGFFAVVAPGLRRRRADAEVVRRLARAGVDERR